MSGTSTPVSQASPAQSYRFAIPFLGLLAAVQGSAPFLSSTALVSVVRDLKLEGSEVALAASIQTLAIAASVVSTGLLADRLGRKKVLMAALVTSAIGLLIVALSPVGVVYMLGQAVIGVGLGATYGAAFAYVRHVSAPGKLPQALGSFGAVSGALTVVLVFMSSALVGVNWRLAFVVYGVVVVVSLLLTPFMLPTQPRVTGERPDLLGQAALALGVIGLLYGVSHLGSSLTSLATWLPFGFGVVLLVVFFMHEARARAVFYPVRLFRSPVFWAAILAGLVYNLGLSVGFLQTTNLWQYVTGVPTDELAVWQLPLNLFGIVGALLFGRLMAKGLSNASAILFSSIAAAVGFVLLAMAHNAQSFLAFLPGLVLVGVALTGASIPFGNLMLQEAPPAHFGPVTSSRTTIGQIWYSIGTALATVMIDQLTTGGVTRRLLAAGVPPDQISTATSAVSTFAATGTKETTALARQALGAATVSYGNAFSVVMIGTGAILAVAGVVGFVLARRGGADDPSRSDPSTPTTATAT